MTARTFIIAAPSSGSGKTSVTLGLLRRLARSGSRVASGKIGPDYIDPGFHAAATGKPSFNFDPWAMSDARLVSQLSQLQADNDWVILESAMGLFDGAADGSATTAKLAKSLDLPVVLVVDCKGMAGSVAPLVHGFLSFDPGVEIAGVILNRVGSDRHTSMLEQALEPLSVPVLAALKSDKALDLPSRHLGLIQAGDSSGLDKKLNALADWVGSALVDGLSQQTSRAHKGAPREFRSVPALGRRIAIAQDAAFSFIYPHLLQDWRGQGADLHFFSPLNDEPVPADCDAVYLPGGYPELHCQVLSQACEFKASLLAAQARGAWIYGECGGYMVLGHSIEDAQGEAWPMTGLLDHSTSFAQPKRSLGYRHLRSQAPTPFGTASTQVKAHEFHYSQQVTPSSSQPLWQAQSATGQSLGSAGQIKGRVFGSYMHLIDLAAGR